MLFEVADDPRFERDGEDLYTEVLVTYPQLVLGAEVSVPTVTGHTTLDVPAGNAERPGLPSARTRIAARERERARATCTCACSSGRRNGSPKKSGSSSRDLASCSPACRPTVAAKGFWAKMKEALGA